MNSGHCGINYNLDTKGATFLVSNGGFQKQTVVIIVITRPQAKPVLETVQ